MKSVTIVHLLVPFNDNQTKRMGTTTVDVRAKNPLWRQFKPPKTKTKKALLPSAGTQNTAPKQLQHYYHPPCLRPPSASQTAVHASLHSRLRHPSLSPSSPSCPLPHAAHSSLPSSSSVYSSWSPPSAPHTTSKLH